MGLKSLNGRISSSWSRAFCLPLLRPCFRVQNTVSANSEIVRACCEKDVSTINELVTSGEAHPNDTTEDNLTLLYVSIYLHFHLAVMNTDNY